MRRISYEDNDPNGWLGDPKRGAALGRKDKHGEPDYRGWLLAMYLPLDKEGYDANGTYYGAGDPLYWVVSVDEGATIDLVVRAKDTKDLEAQLGSSYPFAKVAFLVPDHLPRRG